MMNDKSFRLDGKVALVTGASYGIGFAIASAMAQAGATIVFNDIKQELVDKGREWAVTKVTRPTIRRQSSSLQLTPRRLSTSTRYRKEA